MVFFCVLLLSCVDPDIKEAAAKFKRDRLIQEEKERNEKLLTAALDSSNAEEFLKVSKKMKVGKQFIQWFLVHEDKLKKSDDMLLSILEKDKEKAFILFENLDLLRDRVADKVLSILFNAGKNGHLLKNIKSETILDILENTPRELMKIFPRLMKFNNNKVNERVKAILKKENIYLFEIWHFAEELDEVILNTMCDILIESKDIWNSSFKNSDGKTIFDLMISREMNIDNLKKIISNMLSCKDNNGFNREGCISFILTLLTQNKSNSFLFWDFIEKLDDRVLGRLTNMWSEREMLVDPSGKSVFHLLVEISGVLIEESKILVWMDRILPKSYELLNLKYRDLDKDSEFTPIELAKSLNKNTLADFMLKKYKESSVHYKPTKSTPQKNIQVGGLSRINKAGEVAKRNNDGRTPLFSVRSSKKMSPVLQDDTISNSASFVHRDRDGQDDNVSIININNYK